MQFLNNFMTFVRLGGTTYIINTQKAETGRLKV